MTLPTPSPRNGPLLAQEAQATSSPTLAVPIARPSSNGAPAIHLISILNLFSEDGTRLSRDEEHINSLTEDFRQRLRDHPDEHPVQTPLRVIRRDPRFLIVAGNYRYLAALRVPLTDMPCIILPGDLDEAALLIEQAKDNELHQGYRHIERARNVLRLVELRGCSQAEAGRLVGILRPERRSAAPIPRPTRPKVVSAATP